VWKFGVRGRGGRASEVQLVPHEYYFGVFVGVVVNFGEPCVDGLEGLRVVEIVDEDDADGVLVVGAGDGAEGLLSGLHGGGGTVSQICILMEREARESFLVANSTPMVGLQSGRKDPLMNWFSSVLLPTEASPIRMYLKT
jgi:hypothetical protein